MRTLSFGSAAQVTNAAPCARWHIVQWQCTTRSIGPLTSKRTAPQRHPPATTFSPMRARLARLPELLEVRRSLLQERGHRLDVLGRAGEGAHAGVLGGERG